MVKIKNMDIKDIYAKVKKYDKKFKYKNSGLEPEILGIYEATTKLSATITLNKTGEEKERKVANLFISAFIIANKLGIENIDTIVENRIKELDEEDNISLIK